MTIIKIQSTSYEFKKGFFEAMSMIHKWCENGTHKTLDELKKSIETAIKLEEMMDK